MEWCKRWITGPLIPRLQQLAQASISISQVVFSAFYRLQIFDVFLKFVLYHLNTSYQHLFPVPASCITLYGCMGVFSKAIQTDLTIFDKLTSPFDAIPNVSVWLWRRQTYFFFKKRDIMSYLIYEKIGMASGLRQKLFLKHNSPF